MIESVGSSDNVVIEVWDSSYSGELRGAVVVCGCYSLRRVDEDSISNAEEGMTRLGAYMVNTLLVDRTRHAAVLRVLAIGCGGRCDLRILIWFRGLAMMIIRHIPSIAAHAVGRP